MKVYYAILLSYFVIITGCVVYEEHPLTVYTPLGESNVLQDVAFWMGVVGLLLQPAFLRARKKREWEILIQISIHIYFLLFSASFWANLYHRGHPDKIIPETIFSMLTFPLIVILLVYFYSLGIKFALFAITSIKKKLTSRDSQHLGCA